MPEIAYLPDPRAGDTPASREFDCDCAGGTGGGGSGDTGPQGPAGATGATGATGAAGAAGPASALGGAGSPEGVVTSNPFVTYYNTTDGSYWVKETGVGNTGWAELLS